MRRSILLRAVTLGLAYAHTFPATHHLGAFLSAPSFSDGWKGFGALLAVGLYLLPVRVQTRGLRELWRRRGLLRAVGWSLAAIHAVPLVEHLPRFVGAGDWSDGWRGIGATIAVVWFLAPVSQQGRLVIAAGRFARLLPAPPSPSRA
jgi:hypothetical protein